MQICADSENDDDFCKQLINRGLIKLNFVNMNITDDYTLSAHIVVNIPVLSSEFRNSQKISILNVGYFLDNEFRKLSLPSDLIMFEDKYYALNAGDCSRNLCHISSVFSDNSAMCVESLLKNETLGCESINYGFKDVCDYRVIDLVGNVVTASSAIFFSTEQSVLGIFTIRNQTVFIPENGKLLCTFENNLEKSFFSMRVDKSDLVSKKQILII